MKLDEIVVGVSRSGDLHKYAFLGELDSEPAFDDLMFVETFLSSEEHVLGLVNSDHELIAVIHLSIRDSGGRWQIQYTETAPEYQNRGCFRYLLIKAVNQHKEILSDDTQTPEAMQAWKSLIKYSGGHMKIWVVHKDGTLSPTTNVDPSEIWHEDEYPSLMITNVMDGPGVIRNESRERSMKKSGLDFRMEINMWFGLASQADGFYNP